jgi:hypothetical protein
MVQHPAHDPLWTGGAVVHARRHQSPTMWHTWGTRLTITRLVTIGGVPTERDLAHGGQAERAWCAACLDRTQGIPSHATVGYICAMLEPARL